VKFVTEILSFKVLLVLYLVLALPWVFTTQDAVRKLFGGSLLVILGVLRGLVFLVVLSSLIGLTLILPHGTGQKRVIVLEDHSLSMGLPDSSGSATSRSQRADSAVTRLVSLLGNDWEIVKLPFGETVQREGDSRGEESVMGGTDIISSVLDAGLTSGDGVSYPIVVVSDGRVTTGPIHVHDVEGAETPVFGLLVGSDPGIFDASIFSLNVSEPLFQGEEVPLRILLSGFGPDSSRVDVTVKLDEKITENRVITLDGNGTRMEIGSLLPAMRPGMHLVEVHVETGGEEFTTVNNTRSLYLKVRRSKRQVFLYSNSPDWDLTFLKRHVGSFPEYEAATVIEPVNGKLTSLEEASRFVSLSEAGENLRRSVETSSVVVLQGDFARIPRSVLETVSGRLRSGDVGVLLLPSVPWKDASSWGEIKALCPFPHGVQKISQAGGVKASGSVSSHPVISTVFGREFGEWEELSPLRYVLTGVSMEKGFMSILSSEAAGSVEVPVAVVTEQGFSGARGLILLGGGFWQWDMFPLQFGRGPYYRKLCQGMLEWLAEPSLLRSSFCEPLTNSVRMGDGVTFRGSSAKGGDILLELEQLSERGRDSSYTFVIETEKSSYSDEIFLSPGVYQYRAREEGTADYATASEGTILVDASSREFDDPRPDPAFMGSLSKTTGGSVFDPGQVESLASAVTAFGNKGVKPLRFEMKSEPVTYLVLLLLFFVELIVRRRKGLP